MRAMTDMEAVYTYEGSYEVNALVAGRDLTGLAAFTKWSNTINLINKLPCFNILIFDVILL